MEITAIGYPLIFFGLLLFFISPKRLYELTVFCIPFSGTSVCYIEGEAFQGAWVRVPFFLGALCLLEYVIRLIRTRKFDIPFYFRTPLLLLFILGTVCMLSLLMPAIIDGKISVKSGYYKALTNAESLPLYFSIQYLTQALYFLFGCFLAYYIAVQNNTQTKLNRSIQIYLNGCFLIAFLGILELTLYYLDFSLPPIFSVFTRGIATPGGVTMLYGVPRVTSATLGAPILAQQLLFVLPLLFFQISKWRFFCQFRLKFYLAVIIVVLGLSTSTTAYVGLVLFLFIVLYDTVQAKITSRAIVLLGLCSIVLGTVIMCLLYNKITTTWSGTERLFSITYALGWFYEYPILGIGWATLQVFDLLSIIMGGMGLMGLWAFLLFLFSLYLNFTRANRVKTRMITAVIYAFFITLVISEIGGFIFYSQFFWFMLGIVIAASAISAQTVHATRLNNKSTTAKGYTLD